MKRSFTLVAVSALLAAAPLAAQTTAPTVAPTAAPEAAPAAMPTTAEAFVPAAVGSNGFEIESSRLALERSQSEPIRQFAQQMIDDHTTATQRLQAAAQEAGLAPVELRLDARHQTMLEQLQGTEGEAFDQAYVEMQRMAHEEAIALFSAYAEGGDQEALRTFAAETLPTLQAHQEMAQSLPAS